MRRTSALLFVAGLAAAPSSVAAGPSHDPRPTPTLEHFEWSTSKGRLGVMVMSLTPELRTHLGASADRGVLVARVEPGTPAAEAGIVVGDVIVVVHGRAIDSAMDVLAALDRVKRGEHVTVELVRDRKTRSVDATITAAAPPALRRWMRMFDDRHVPGWFRDWLTPFEPRRAETPETPEMPAKKGA